MESRTMGGRPPQGSLIWEQFGSVRIAFADSMADVPFDARLMLMGSKSRCDRLTKDLQRENPRVEIVSHVRPRTGRITSVAPFLSSKFAMPKDDLILLIDSVHWAVRISASIQNGFRHFIVLKPKERMGSFRHCIICHEKKFIFVPIYKSLYTSLQVFMAKQFVEFHGRRADTLRLSEITDLKAVEFENYFKFSVIRNPWDRTLSCYYDKFTRPADHSNSELWRPPIGVVLGDADFGFEAFVAFISRIPDSHADRHWVSQSANLYGPAGTQLVNYIGRFENIQDDIKEISKLAGVDFAIKRLNPSEKGQRAVDLIDARMDRLIRDRYSEDIQRFGYDFTAPKQQAV